MKHLPNILTGSTFGLITKLLDSAGLEQMNISQEPTILYGLIAIGFIAGASAFGLARLCIRLTTKPLDTILDSWWGNFNRYTLKPLAWVNVVGGLGWCITSLMVLMHYT